MDMIRLRQLRSRFADRAAYLAFERQSSIYEATLILSIAFLSGWYLAGVI